MIEKVFIKILYDINKDLKDKKLYNLKNSFKQVLEDFYNGKLSFEDFRRLLQVALAIYKVKNKEEKREFAEKLLAINRLDKKYFNFVLELTKLNEDKIRSYLYALQK